MPAANFEPRKLRILRELPQLIVVTGAAGQLGSVLCEILGEKAICATREILDLAQPEQLASRLKSLSPQVIINAAAYTAVDRAEDPTERDLCHTINARAVQEFARIANELEIPLIQVSTDYVFCRAPLSHRPFRESDLVAPDGVYALSKYAGELAAQQAKHHTIVRTCGVYGTPPSPRARNFVMTMLRLSEQHANLRVVDDQICSPTCVTDLAWAILELLHARAVGTFHVTNTGGTSWCNFARTIFQLAGRSTTVTPITTAEYGAAAPRPSYSVLDTSLYQATTHATLRPWNEALAEFLAPLSLTSTSDPK